MRVGLSRALAGRRGERRRVPRRAGRGGPAHRAVASVERGELPRAVGHRRRPQRGLSADAADPPASGRASRRHRAGSTRPRANGTMRWPVTASARRGVPGSCSAMSRWSAPARSIVPVSIRPLTRGARVTATRRRTRSRSDEAERHPLGERGSRGRRACAAQHVGMRHPDARRSRRTGTISAAAIATASSATQSAPTPVTSADRTVPSATSNDGGAASRSRGRRAWPAARAARPATGAAARPRCRARRARPPTRRRADPRGRRRSDPSAPSEARAIITTR